MLRNYDLSDLGKQRINPSNNYDLSDLGTVSNNSASGVAQSASNQLMQMANAQQQSAQSSVPMVNTMMGQMPKNVADIGKTNPLLSNMILQNNNLPQFSQNMQQGLTNAAMAMAPEFGALSEATPGIKHFGMQTAQHALQLPDMLRNAPSIVSGPLNAAGRYLQNIALGGAANVGNSDQGSILQRFEQGKQQSELPAMLGEAATAPFRAIKGVAELITPQEFANSAARSIKNQYDVGKKETQNIYEGLKKNYGNDIIYKLGNQQPPLNYLKQFDPADLPMMPNSVKNLHNAFIANPTYANAQDLQRQYGSEMGRINSSTDAYTNKVHDTMQENRNALMGDIDHFFMNHGAPGDREAYQYARAKTRDFLIPHEQNPLIDKIISGKKSVKPNDLSNALTDLSEKTRNDGKPVLPADHYLRGIKSVLSDKIQRGEFARYAVPGVLGSAAAGAGALFGGPYGASLGAAAGTGVGATIPPVAHNPWVMNRAAEINNLLQGSKRLYIGNKQQE